MEALISVIVPVYNKAPYLARCFESIRRQTYQNIEILIVDDASSDDSLALCRAFAASEPRAKVTALEKNVGASAARNTALCTVRGEYVAFVDADDEIAPEMLGTLCQALQNAGADIACGGMAYLKTDGSTSHTSGLVDGTMVLDRETAMERMLAEFPRREHLEISVCNKLYTRRILDGIRFPEGLCSEDYLVNYAAFSRAKRVVSVGLPLYFNHMGDDGDSFSRGQLSEANITALYANELVCTAVQKDFARLLAPALIRYISVISAFSLAAVSTKRMPYRNARRTLLKHYQKARRFLAVCPDPRAKKSFHDRVLDVLFPHLHGPINRMYLAYRRLVKK